MMNFLKQTHKWIGVGFVPFILLFALSGIVLNHRDMFSGIDVDRKHLPDQYEYENWNNAAVKGTERIGDDDILIYGNVGVWRTNDDFNGFSGFNAGFPDGVDNRKIEKVYKASDGTLFAGTLFGLYQYDFDNSIWRLVELLSDEKRIVDIAEAEGELIILTRSHILRSRDYEDYEVLELPEPEVYNNTVSLFKTLWTLHGGEAFGIPAILLVDSIGIIFVFLTLTGLLLFVIPYIMGKGWQSGENYRKKVFKFTLKWHNRIGWITLVLLIFTTFTGMFLRPPLLLFIAALDVPKLPLSELSDENPWNDKLRRIIYDETDNRYIVATLDGVYYSDDNFGSKLKMYDCQPPLSIMGVTVFHKIEDGVYLVGSFNGLYVWQPETGLILNYITSNTYSPPSTFGPPIGRFAVTGYTSDCVRGEYVFDYNTGAIPLGKSYPFPKMPGIVLENSPMSLWNAALEVHTGRIYSVFLGSLYILFIPLVGLLILFELISGFVVWWKFHKK